MASLLSLALGFFCKYSSNAAAASLVCFSMISLAVWATRFTGNAIIMRAMIILFIILLFSYRF